MQNLLDEHPAQRQRQLINQAADAQLFIVHDIFIRLEDFANLQRHLRFLIGTGNILQIAYNRTAGNINTAVCFRIQCFLDGLCNAVDFVRGFLLAQLLHQNNAVLIHRRYKILCFCRENAPYNFHHIHFLINIRFNQIHDTMYVIFNMQLLRAAVNIHQQQVIQQQILDKVVLIISFFIRNQKALNLECGNLADLIAGFVLPLHLNHILRHAVVINLKILIAQN